MADEPATCPTCGTRVKVVGGTTKHYEPIAEPSWITADNLDLAQRGIRNALCHLASDASQERTDEAYAEIKMAALCIGALEPAPEPQISHDQSEDLESAPEPSRVMPPSLDTPLSASSPTTAKENDPMANPFTDKDRARLWFLARHTEAVTPGCLLTRVVAYIERLEADLDHSERALEREAQRRVAAEIESEMARAALKGEDG